MRWSSISHLILRFYGIMFAIAIYLPVQACPSMYFRAVGDRRTNNVNDCVS